MKDLSLADGIGGSGNYLNGNIVDNQTEINAFINQDIVQFFQKLAALGSITFNDDFDNEVNGYQLIEALDAQIDTLIAAQTGGVKMKKIDINDWNMDSTSTLGVNHGLTFAKILYADVQIILDDDVGTQSRPLDWASSTGAVTNGSWTIDATQVVMTRVDTGAGGVFDSTSYDKTSFNRGFIIVYYIA